MYKPKLSISPDEYSRQIKNRGDYRREQQRIEEEANKKNALNSLRAIEEDLHIQGIGQLKMQILYLPSFETNYLWDIRQVTESGTTYYTLYENELVSRQQIAPGYKQILIPTEELAQLIEKIYATNISLRITPWDMYGLDGSITGIHIFENYCRVIKVSWWGEPQEELLDLHQLIQRYIEAFINNKEKKNVV